MKKQKIILPEQFCTVEKCSICKNNIYDSKTNVCPHIDLKTSNITKIFKKTYLIIGDFNLLDRIVLKSGVSSNEKANIPLVKVCAINEKYYWERLVNTDSQRRILFTSNLNDDRFKNHFPFHMLESKFKYDLSVTMSYLIRIKNFHW